MAKKNILTKISLVVGVAGIWSILVVLVVNANKKTNQLPAFDWHLAILKSSEFETQDRKQEEIITKVLI